MDKEKIVHDLAMACLNVRSLPTGETLVEEAVKDYSEKGYVDSKMS